MKDMREFLAYYNNIDVEPFCEAVLRMQDMYMQLGCCFLKDAISAPGIARRFIFESAQKRGYSFPIFNAENADLFHTICSNLSGGASLIFHRYHEGEKTNICVNPTQICKSVYSYDANALYLRALSQELPVTNFVSRKADNEFRSEK